MLNWSAPSQSAVFAAALGTLKANVMIANNNLIITYVNSSLFDFLQKSEDELRQDLPRFSIATLIGSNIDVFHKNPAHQRNMLATMDKTHNATIRVGKHAFDLIVSPLRRGNKRIGFVVEWADANVRLLNADYTAQIAAVGRSQAMVEFTPDGAILSANKNFLGALGYRLEEIVGKHHSIFVETSHRDSPEYRDLWANLKRGEYQAAQYKRIGKDGRDVWIQASYNPIIIDGKVVKVVKVATDVTPTVHAVQVIGSALSALSHGNLEQRLTENLPGGLEKLRTDLNLALSQLQDAMRSVVETSQSILNGSSEITHAADNLSQRTEQQAASLEQTAAALDQITATVRNTAEGAQHAREVVGRMKADAEHSGEVVRQAVCAMAEIEKSSSKVSQIIGVIDEIAFQTNLLALNAGVEAARAGDAGRGFAVVASEVRALAQRSADAAREIKALISASSQQVGTGVKLVGETGTVLSRIVTQVAEINGVVANIAASAQEQSTGLAEINTAVNSMDQVTQQNAGMVEESTAASHALADEAKELSRLIGRFQLGASATVARPDTDPPRLTSKVGNPDARSAKPAPALKVIGRGGAATAAASAPKWTEF